MDQMNQIFDPKFVGGAKMSYNPLDNDPAICMQSSSSHVLS